VRRIPYADYRINQMIPVIDKDDFNAIPKNTDTEMDDEDDHGKMEARLYRKRYGIKIEFYQSGKLGKRAEFVGYSPLLWVDLELIYAA
jgi:hypothetical protein